MSQRHGELSNLFGEEFFDELRLTLAIIFLAFLALTAAFAWNTGPIEHDIHLIKTPIFRSALLIFFTITLLSLSEK